MLGIKLNHVSKRGPWWHKQPEDHQQQRIFLFRPEYSRLYTRRVDYRNEWIMISGTGINAFRWFLRIASLPPLLLPPWALTSQDHQPPCDRPCRINVSSLSLTIYCNSLQPIIVQKSYRTQETNAPRQIKSACKWRYPPIPPGINR